jgi:hypothetical protein
MTKRNFDNYPEAASYARRLARETGITATLKRNGSEWKVNHPRISSDDNNNQKGRNNSSQTVILNERNKKNRKTYSSRDNSFRFAIRKTSSTEPVIADSPNVEKNKIIEVVKEYFPNATIESEIKVRDEAGTKISDWRRQYLILIKIQDKAMSEEEFDELLNELADEFDSMRLEY